MSQEKGLILIVEDESGISMYMEEIFKYDGFQVATAENGKAALDLLRTMEILPALIFLDLMMPVMDGQRFINAIQKHPENSRFKEIPVVVVTATADHVTGDIVEVIRKPPDIDHLTKLAEKFAQ